MQKIFHAVLLLGVASSTWAETPAKSTRPLPDAPPPPQIAPAEVAVCCTATGRYAWLNPDPEKLPIEEAACEAKTAEGLKPGTICY